MKSKLLFSVIAFVAVLQFSCQPSLTIAKKRYSNGYYVSVSHDKKVATEPTKTTDHKKDLTAASKEITRESATVSEAVFNPEVRELKTAPLKNTSIAPGKPTLAETLPFVKKSELTKVLETENSDSQQGGEGLMTLLLIILCFVLPPLAVALATDSVSSLLISILLTLLFWIPGVIYALIVVIRR
jgi:uncharacterized membrane protein YqaE (UPF0057 family)